MGKGSTRRTFLQAAVASGTVLQWSGWAPLARSASGAAAADTSPGGVSLRPEIADTVRLLEDTPRERLIEEVAHRINQGLSYQQVVTALQLAGVRNVQPRPSVGFKFHAVLVVNSAHLASLAAPDAERWFPIFWALDYFKDSQARDVREGNWTMQPVREQAVPQPSQAIGAFVDAIEAWDEQRADAAAAALARFPGAAAVFEQFFHYGCRDFRSIGHKAIFVSNAQRALQYMGWQHAEPILRSLAYALLNHHGEPDPATHDLEPDRPWKRNLQLVKKIKPQWTDGRPDQGATVELLATLRQASPEEACDHVVQLLNSGVGAQSIWDALFLGAGELIMRQTGIVALHAMTSTNAMHYAFTVSGDDTTRRLLLLQNTAFLPLFRQAMLGRGKVGDQQIDKLEPTELDQSGAAGVEEILAEVSSNRSAAAAKVLHYLERESAEPLIRGAHRLLALKSTGAHDYKFGSAVLEDYYHVSTHWRPQFMAGALFLIKGSGVQDSGIVQRTRAAFTA